MPDVSSHAPVDVRLWVALNVHKLSIVAAILPPTGGQPEVQRIETTRVAIRLAECIHSSVDELLALAEHRGSPVVETAWTGDRE